ncbi:MAG TPA: hypothetical protein VFE36_08220 [Candidatus Baltobacteraceae bacterium]|nr:hypothetical protein [Candidatus Baltobacteraceae bacterium]
MIHLVLAALIGIGINYNWYAFHLESLHDCRTNGESRSVGTWILPQYGDPVVRATVRRQLAQMHASGFTTLRVLVFYDHSTDTEDDSFTSLDGSLMPADARKLRDFVSDVARAGFRSLELGPAFVNENSLYCKRHAWGDCFDPKRTDENWRFISGVATVAVSAAGATALRFDLGNEQAPDPRMPAATLQNAKAYLGSIATRFQSAFGPKWLFSTARSDPSNASETADRLGLLVDDLSSAGLKPPFLEVHSYSADGNDLKQSLDDTQRIAHSIDAGVILGELAYHSDVQANTVAAWIARNPNSRLVDVLQWPERDPSQVCAIDPVPPYTPGPFYSLGSTRRM